MARSLSGLREQAGTVAVIAAVQLLVAAAATELAGAAGFVLGRPLSPSALACGAIAALATAAWASRADGYRPALVATTLVVLVFAAGLLLAGSTFDISWDGQNYHQPGVLAIAEGWNPLRAPLPVKQPYTAPYWVNHYAKGPWIRAAAVLLATGHVEVAKVWNFALAAAAALASAGAVLWMRSVRAPYAVAAAAVAALNPVFASQMFTFYVDGQLASTFTALVALAAVTATVAGPLPLLGIGAAVMLLPGIKFTGLAYALLLTAVIPVALSFTARRRVRGTVLAIGCGLAAAIVTTWNPYATNLRRDGHPFHPVAGSKAVDVMAGQAPPEFLARSRVEKLGIATFSASRHRNDAKPTLKWPFTFKGDEFTLFQHPDARFGGFGPLFSGGLVLCALAFAAAVRDRRRAAVISGAVAVALVATVLINPEGWWARYAPQLWLVPTVLALSAAGTPGRRAALLAGLTLAVLGADALLVTINAARRLRAKSEEVEAHLHALAREPSPIVVQFIFESNRRRLLEAGVPFVESDRLPCSAPEKVPYSETRFCRGVARDDLSPR